MISLVTHEKCRVWWGICGTVGHFSLPKPSICMHHIKTWCQKHKMDYHLVSEDNKEPKHNVKAKEKRSEKLMFNEKVGNVLDVIVQ